MTQEIWFDDYVDESEEDQVIEYDITAAPNDFNIMTLFSFMESGAIVMPAFQRNYVWDQKRASRLIESLVLGLPVPQIFLYEQARNRFLVIDGQQRLMSIYYFIKQRFPRKEARAELRRVFEEQGKMPDDVLHNDTFFTNFRLQLPSSVPAQPHRFNGLSYTTLGESKSQFDLRAIRNVIIKQNAPTNDDSSIYEIFNRLNTGGVNLTSQEIRLSLYHSAFYDVLMRINIKESWRRLLNTPEPDLHLKDIEILLRMVSMLLDSAGYSPSMTRFLNQVSKKCRQHDAKQNGLIEKIFDGFLDACAELPKDTFLNKKNRRFNIALVEAVFVAACAKPLAERRAPAGMLNKEQIALLEGDEAFVKAAARGTTQTGNVKTRLDRGRAIIASL